MAFTAWSPLQHRGWLVKMQRPARNARRTMEFVSFRADTFLIMSTLTHAPPPESICRFQLLVERPEARILSGAAQKCRKHCQHERTASESTVDMTLPHLLRPISLEPQPRPRFFGDGIVRFEHVLKRWRGWLGLATLLAVLSTAKIPLQAAEQVRTRTATATGQLSSDNK